jgi:hypothetical protein
LSNQWLFLEFYITNTKHVQMQFTSGCFLSNINRLG